MADSWYLEQDQDGAPFTTETLAGACKLMAGEELKRGDLVTLNKVPVYRKWWQFWRPAIVRYEDRAFRVKGWIGHGR